MTPEGGSRRRTRRRDSVIVQYEGQRYERDLARCRRALLQGKVEKRFRTMDEFAELVGLSQTTASRFLSGAERASMAATSRLLAGLGLTFEEVHRKVEAAREGSAQ